MSSICLKLTGPIFAVLVFSSICLAQSSSFTYQGRFMDAGVPVTGPYDFTFRLFDVAGGGTQIGSDVVVNDAQVAAGIFTVTLDFGASPFTSTVVNFLEISVRNGASTGAFTLLNPRQPLTSSPYAVQAAVAGNSNQLGGVAANQYVITTDPRLTDARTPTAGSGDYVQNRNTVQSATSFNISGNGQLGGFLAANSVRSETQFNIAGNRVLSIPGLNNTFVGERSGFSHSSGSANSFFGRYAGSETTSGSSNSFFGSNAGLVNTSNDNSFFGASAGLSNTTGNSNSFFGTAAGQSNSTGFFNSFFGRFAGSANSTGTENSFFGHQAGISNTTASQNSFFGRLAGRDNVTGTSNSFFGWSAGRNNTSSENSFFGHSAGFATLTGNANSFFGASAGGSNTSGIGNSFFGRHAGLSNTEGTGNSFFGSSAGRNNTGDTNSFFGIQAGMGNTTGDGNAFFGNIAGVNNTQGVSNSFFGGASGITNTTGDNNTLIGSGADVGSGNLSFATAIGAGAVVTESNRIQIGRAVDAVRIPGGLRIEGLLAVETLDGGGTTALCQNGLQRLSTCSSSLRYKTNINGFGPGLNLVNQLKPITFDWKDGGIRDLGLGAEDVAVIEPLLVTYNTKGEVEGVKYDRIGVVLINAVKQQQQIIERQNTRIDELVKLVCLTNKEADICKEK